VAIIKCVACSAEVNAQATACPQCGVDPRTGEWLPGSPQAIRATLPPAVAPSPRARALGRTRSLLKTHVGIYLVLTVFATIAVIYALTEDDTELLFTAVFYLLVYAVPAAVLLATKPWRRRDLTRYRWLIFLAVFDALLAVDYLSVGGVVRGLGFAALAAFTGLAVGDLRRLHGGAPGLSDAAPEDAPAWTPDAPAGPGWAPPVSSQHVDGPASPEPPSPPATGV
jgi:hypothetical protein